MEIRHTIDDGIRQIEASVTIQHSYEPDERNSVYVATPAEVVAASDALSVTAREMFDHYHP